MKQIKILLSILFLMAVSWACKKDLEPNSDNFGITDHVEVGTSTATITGTYSWEGKLVGMKVLVSKRTDFGDASTFETVLEGDQFSVTVTDLEGGTKYNYRYLVNYGGKNDYLTGMESFTTMAVSLPAVVTAAVTEMGDDYVVCGGNVSDNGGAEVTMRGICYGVESQPDLNGLHTEAGGGNGAFTSRLEGLQSGVRYYARAYATNVKGTSYGDDISFTIVVGLPTVTTSQVTEINSASAKCGGEVTDHGLSMVTERGVCWSTANNPTVEDEHVSNGSGLGNFEVTMTGLAPNTTYYVRAYATNEQGTAYGSEESFTTLDGPPSYLIKVSASPAEGGTVTGGGNYTEGQPCTLTATANPAYAFVRWIKDGEEVSTSSTYTFQVNSPAEYVAEFIGIPFVEIEVVNVTKTAISVKTKISNFEASSISGKGICYGQSPELTYYSHETIPNSGNGSEFYSDITGLTPGDRYYMRSYVMSNGELSYSEVIDTLTVYPWYYLTDIPGQPRTQSFSFAIGSKAYVGAGVYQNYMYLSDMWEYDTETGVWTQKADYPEGKVRGPMAFVLNDKAYVGLGYKENGTNEGEKMDSFYEYDPVMNSWTRKHDYPGGWDEYDNRDATVLNGKGYCFTGEPVTKLGEANNRGWGVNLYEYDPSSDRWTFISTLTDPYYGYWFSNHISAEAIGSHLYVYTRNHDGNWGRDGVAFYQYNMEYNTWVDKGCPVPITYSKMESYVMGDCFYLFSGKLYGGVTNTITYKYDPLSETWTENVACEPKIFRYSPVCLFINGKLYYGGGEDGGNQRSIWVYDPSLE